MKKRKNKQKQWSENLCLWIHRQQPITFHFLFLYPNNHCFYFSLHHNENTFSTPTTRADNLKSCLLDSVQNTRRYKKVKIKNKSRTSKRKSENNPKTKTKKLRQTIIFHSNVTFPCLTDWQSANTLVWGLKSLWPVGAKCTHTHTGNQCNT